ncbi:MAG: antibiotic biosynthesis monooxygenase [Candidatus Dormibacteria bacterium]
MDELNDTARLRYWNVQTQLVDPERIDQYLESVADQQRALGDSPAFGARLVLRSQRNPARFWLVDEWADRRSLETGAIALRTLSSVAALTQPPRELPTEQVPLAAEGAGLAVPERQPDDPLPLFLIVENQIKPSALEDYLAMQEEFTAELMAHDGFWGRLLLRDLGDPAHLLVIDQWQSEPKAFAAFEERQATLDPVTMIRFRALLAGRGEQDAALGLHA